MQAFEQARFSGKGRLHSEQIAGPAIKDRVYHTKRLIRVLFAAPCFVLVFLASPAFQ